jgi:glutaminyl-tRNA synthetase
VSAAHAVPAEVRIYDRLFTEANPGAADDIDAILNPNSLEVVDAMLESSLEGSQPGNFWQFERLGYFCTDAVDHTPEKPVINRIVTLRDSWAKLEKAALKR